MNGILGCMIALATLGTARDYSKVLPANYESLRANQKRNVLLSLTHDRADALWRPGFLPLSPKANIGNLISLADFRTTFTRVSDVMPYGRARVIHARGSMAAVTFNGNPDSSFSGLYRQTGVPGIARISLAGPPTGIVGVGVTPGMGLKFFVDGAPSANLIVMKSVNGQGANTNIFEETFSNIVPPPEGSLLKTLGKRFDLTVTDPTILSVSQLAEVNKDGTAANEVKVPYQLFFEPTPEVQLPRNSPNDFRDDLRTLRPGTTLYRIYGIAEKGGKKEWVGDLVLDEKFAASQFGDEGIFFRHSSDFLRPFGK